MKKALRIKDNREFSTLISKKQYVSSLCFSIYFQKRTLNHARVGISAPTKLGNAVIRNKIKRQVRMMVQDIYTFNEDFDSIIIVKKPYLKNSFAQNKAQLKSVYENVIMKRERKGENNEKRPIK